MPGFLATINSKAQCPHGGMSLPMVPNPRVKIMGQPIPMIASPVPINPAMCQMKIPPPAGPGPTPCITGQWVPISGTTRVKSQGQPLVCETTMGTITATTPPSPPGLPLKIAAIGQTKVKGM